jgi:hypothetical protein
MWPEDGRARFEISPSTQMTPKLPSIRRRASLLSGPDYLEGATPPRHDRSAADRARAAAPI